METFQNRQKTWKIRQNTCFWHQNTSVFGIFRCEKAVSRPFLGRFWWFFRFFPSKKHIGTVSSSLQAFSTTYMVSKVMCAAGGKIFYSFFENLKNLKANFTMRKKSKKIFFAQNGKKNQLKMIFKQKKNFFFPRKKIFFALENLRILGIFWDFWHWVTYTVIQCQKSQKNSKFRRFSKAKKFLLREKKNIFFA